jgi:hypothetical protein
VTVLLDVQRRLRADEVRGYARSSTLRVELDERSPSQCGTRDPDIGRATAAPKTLPPIRHGRISTVSRGHMKSKERYPPHALMAQGGQYAQLYSIQAAAYQ